MFYWNLSILLLISSAFGHPKVGRAYLLTQLDTSLILYLLCWND